ncbi:hypothetical protein BOX15_Mlig005280g1, partial [Macrostomum lignano]
SGYYGHNRDSHRNDIYTEYRRLAKPQPPRVFLTRMKDDPVRHIFSKHDNRYSFITDATYLDLGVGKKRKVPESRCNRVTDDLISWAPQMRNLKEGAEPALSAYKQAFTAGRQPAQLLVSRPKTSFDEDAQVRQTTSYRYAFGPELYNPNKTVVEAIGRPAVLARPCAVKPKPPAVGVSRARTACDGRLSVADCLTWQPHGPESACAGLPRRLDGVEAPLGRSFSRFGPLVPEATPTCLPAAADASAAAAAD